MKKLISLLILLIVAVVEIYNLSFWLMHCKNFQEFLHVNFQGLLLQLQGEMSQDTGVPFLFVRLFHNKIVDACLLVLRTYFRFWDFVFQGGLFPFVGGLGILTAAYYFFNSKIRRLWQWLLFLIFIFLPFMELVLSAKVPFFFRIAIYYLVFGVISLLGLNKFVKEQKWGWLIVVLLIIVSVWWLLAADFHLAFTCYQYP